MGSGVLYRVKRGSLRSGDIGSTISSALEYLMTYRQKGVGLFALICFGRIERRRFTITYRYDSGREMDGEV